VKKTQFIILPVNNLSKIEQIEEKNWSRHRAFYSPELFYDSQSLADSKIAIV
jgi:hypothetical protein